MELNVQLVNAFEFTQPITAIAGNTTHNIFKLSPGLCHADLIDVKLNGESLPPESFLKLYGSSEFQVRYGLASCAAIMLLDNSIKGSVVISCRPIGGSWQNVNYGTMPASGTVSDHYGRWLEEVGSIEGIQSFGRRFEDIPSRATDLDGITLGMTSYPGSGEGTSVDALEKRVSGLEEKLYHDEVNVPVLPEYPKAFVVHDKAAPRIQFTSDEPDPTWYYSPKDSEVAVGINPVTGELMWVDGNATTGIYNIDIYIMANGIRSENRTVTLNVL